MSAAYLRELEHARRAAGDLCDLLHPARPLDEVTVERLAQAIDLADAAHRALLSAMSDITEGEAP